MKLRAPLALLIGAALFFFGLACLNYCKPSSVEHHEEWAAETGAPPPGDGILLGGGACIAAGVGLLGFGVSAARGGSRRLE